MSSLIYTPPVNLEVVATRFPLLRSGASWLLKTRIETAIAAAIASAQGGAAPPRLASALDYAVNPGGARIRPTICMSVAMACGDTNPAMSDAAATAIELIHCASLVHDDMPCFDNADIRRGKPTVHRAYGEPLALLTGDTLIVAAFEVLARAAGSDPDRAVSLIRILGESTGMPGGICAGQGWESESKIDLSAYHRAKTGALFTAATRMGAAAAGEEPPTPGPSLARGSGRPSQVADDLRDALYDEVALGKPAHQDEINGRPNAVAQLGVKGAIRRLEDILSGAIASIPSCPGGGRALRHGAQDGGAADPRGSRPADGLTLVDQRRHASPASEPLGPGLCLAHRAFAGRARSRRPPPARPSPHAWRARTGRRCSTSSRASSIRRCCAPSSTSTSPRALRTGRSGPRNWRSRPVSRPSGCAFSARPPRR